MSASLDQDRSLLRDTARAAGALAADYFKRGFTHWEKAPGDPVSIADIEVNKLIAAQLRAIRPDYGWLSEETKDTPARLAAKRLWVVDPIDGTRAFVNGRAEFCVSIALVEDNAAIMGCVYDPIGERFFFGEKAKGATLNGAAIHVSARQALTHCRLLANSDILRSKIWRTPWPEMEIAKPNSMALRIALVAAGEYDAAISIRAKHDWDVAAAGLILEEAGGVMTDHEGRPLASNQPDPKHRSIIAAAPGLHAELMRRMADAWPDWQTRRKASERRA